MISIIGALSTGALTSLQGARNKAKEAKMSAILEELEKAANLDYTFNDSWSPDVGPNKCTASCWAAAGYPRFVTDGHYQAADYDDNKWYCPTCCYDYQNWDGGNWISLDVYEITAGCGANIVKRRCIYDAPGGGTCVNF
mgnify:CR=1 FL=1